MLAHGSARGLVFVGVVLVVGACDDGRHHPDGFVAGAKHGPALKRQDEDCRSCHGEELAGGANGEASCDGCHAGATPTAWRSDCTFCHGGVENETGAPPRNLDGTDQVGPFPVHTIHVTGSDLAVAYDCTQCHVKAIDVLSPGHVFDDTPREAENDFGAGLSPQTRFSLPDRTCTNNFCHGTGRGDDGAIAALDGPLACDGCHPAQASSPAAWSAMSGLHALHLTSPDVTCNDCHGDTTADGATIADRTIHVDGRRQVSFGDAVVGVGYDVASQTCDGTCHGVAHAAYSWSGGANPHPTGFAAPEVHGTEMELQRSDCRGCHGADLTGGSGRSCDSCHQAGWRSDCTYCHGGGLDTTGAPPSDLGSTDDSSAQSFVAHPVHVAQRIAAASDCTQCHVKPSDVMTANHAFDSTPMIAEITFAAGSSPATTYDGNGTCGNNYCHGNGRASGTITDGAGPRTCQSCHPFNALGGSHRDHDEDGMDCQDCHASVVGTGGQTVIAPLLHVDGQRQISILVTTLTYDAGTRRCNGPCHGRNHGNDGW
jgi:hypothetical protein